MSLGKLDMFPMQSKIIDSFVVFGFENAFEFNAMRKAKEDLLSCLRRDSVCAMQMR